MQSLIKKTLPFFVFFAIFFVPRIIGLGWDEWNVDAQRWMIRSDLFVKALFSGDLNSMYQSYHPGITLMWLSGLSKAAFYWGFEQIAGYSPKFTSGFVYPEQFYITSFAAKLPLIAVISLLLTYSILLLKRLGIPKAHLIFFAVLLSLEPFYLGITKFFHLSGLESAFVFASFITVLYASLKNKICFFALAGFLVGSAFFTKSSGLVVIPALLLLLLIVQLKNHDFKTAIINSTKYTLVLILTSIASLFILFPYMFLDPIGVIGRIFSEGVEDKGFIDGAHPSILQFKVTYYFEIFFVKSLGITFITFLTSLYLVFKEKDRNYKFILITLLTYVFYYFLMMSVPSKQMTRYMSVAYPFIIFVSSYSIYRLYLWTLTKKYLTWLLLGALSIYFLTITYMMYPVYSAYHTELLGGMRGYSEIRKPYNDGEYYLQVAEYLNSYPGIKPHETVLIITEGNKDASAKFGFNGTTYSGKISEPDKKYSSLFYATDFTDTEDFPEGCERIKEFGPRFPLKFGFVYLFRCK